MDLNALDDSNPDAALYMPNGGMSVELIRCRFEQNGRGAVDVRSVNHVLMEDCVFADHDRLAVGTLYCPDVTVRGCTFLRNTSSTSSAGGITFGQSNGTVDWCTFAYDSATASYGGAVTIASGSNAVVRNNTFYRCFSAVYGSAVQVSQSSALVSNNIAVEMTGAALGKSPTSTILPGSGCNLLWGNTADYSSTWDPEATVTDIVSDPLFCDPEALDLTVDSASPAVEENSPDCGAIGAHGVGCGTVSLEPETWGRIKARFIEEARR